MATQSHNSALLDLSPETIIELFEIDLGEQDGILYIHPGKNNDQNIFLSDDNGKLQEYVSLPIEAQGFEFKGDGSLPRPNLKIANANGYVSDFIKKKNDLIGNYVTRKRIFLKFLDNENFPNNFNPFSAPDPSSRFEDDIFLINQKTEENKYFVNFELVSPLEFEGSSVPARTVFSNYCPWRYRGCGCLYGKRSDYSNQKMRMANGSEVTAETFFANENPGGIAPNLGLPIADENDKSFVGESGYNLTLTWLGDYNSSSITVISDQVATTSASTQSINVEALSGDIEKDRTIVFSNGAKLKLTVEASEGDTSVTGILSIDDLADGTSGSLKYVEGDVVRIKAPNDKSLKFSAEKDKVSAPDLFFVCILDAQTSKDPRYDFDYWRSDSCSKSFSACKMRYLLHGEYKRGLPFGGFPSTQRFGFKV